MKTGIAADIGKGLFHLSVQLRRAGLSQTLLGFPKNKGGYQAIDTVVLSQSSKIRHQKSEQIIFNRNKLWLECSIHSFRLL